MAVLNTHLVLFPVPIAGRLSPFMVLARRLARRGCTVSFVYFKHRSVQVQEAHSTRAAKDPLIQLVPLQVSSSPDVLDSTTHARVQDSRDTVRPLISLAAHESVSAAFQDLLDQLQPSCVITCEVMAGSLQTVCKSKLVKHCVLFPMSATVLALAFHAGNLAKRNLLPLDTVEDLEVPGLGKFPVTSGENNLVHRMLTEPNVFYHRCTQCLHDSSIVFINSFYHADPCAFTAFESPELNPSQVKVLPLGPMLPHDFTQDSNTGQMLSEELLSFLNKQLPESVVYICFGSIGLPSKDQTAELAGGLVASKKPFVWMLNATDIHQQLPEGFLQQTRQQGLVTNTWMPQLDLLSHPAVGVFLTHCGWNSTVEAMALGKPVLTMPYMADQYANSWILAKQLGMGMELSKDGSGLAECLSLIMDSEEGIRICDRARAAKAAATGALASAEKNLDVFLETLE